ncbi:MAG: hypothetical protein BroJett011_03180 [Chloroflexota bacterium]|nr:MAG: hypothetical protein BroJett011_03180 [Chloroflexota bacterium]
MPFETPITIAQVIQNIDIKKYLEGIPNQEKSDTDFKKWLWRTYPDESERKDYMKKHYIPDIDLSFGNFEDFIAARKKLMTKKFEAILKL